MSVILDKSAQFRREQGRHRAPRLRAVGRRQHAGDRPLRSFVIVTGAGRGEAPGKLKPTRPIALSPASASRCIYPDTAELLAFGREVCGVSEPFAAITRIAEAMHETLLVLEGDPRIPPALRDGLREQWAAGMAHASADPASSRTRRRHPRTAAIGNTP